VRFKPKRGYDLSAQDAYWQIPSSEYVPTAPAPTSHPLNDRARVASAWSATVDTLRKEAHESPQARTRLVAEVESFEHEYEQRRQDRGVDRPVGSQPGDKAAGAASWTSSVLTFLHSLKG